MANSKNGVDYMSAPKNYAELFEVYYAYVVNLVNRMGIKDSLKEDVASEILTRFYERDFLAQFDPTLVFIYAGEERPARFKSFLSKFVLAYVRGHYDKQQRQSQREVLICDLPISADGAESKGSTAAGLRWVEVFGEVEPSHEDDVLDQLEEEALVQGLRAYLATVPRRSKYDNCDLVMLFDEVMLQIRVYGEPNIAQLKDIFHVSSTAMHTWMWWLKENLAEATGRPVPAKRPRTTRTSS